MGKRVLVLSVCGRWRPDVIVLDLMMPAVVGKPVDLDQLLPKVAQAAEGA